MLTARVAQRLLALTAAIWHNRRHRPARHKIPGRLRPPISFGPTRLGARNGPLTDRHGSSALTDDRSGVSLEFRPRRGAGRRIIRYRCEWSRGQRSVWGRWTL